MDKETGSALRELLQTMGEALGHLNNNKNEDLRKMVGECSQQAAGILESVLPRPLEHQVHASALSDEDWLRTACLVLAEEEEPFSRRMHLTGNSGRCWITCGPTARKSCWEP